MSAQPVQLQQDDQDANVIQRVKGCKVCGHKHGSTKCTTLVAAGYDEDGNKLYKQCGCLSHSSKHDSGGKFNPGSGKRARMLERMRGNK